MRELNRLGGSLVSSFHSPVERIPLPRRPDSPLLGGVFKADRYHRFLFLGLHLLGHKMPNPFCRAGENQIVSALEPMQCMAVSLNECFEVKRGPERNWGHSLVLHGPRA